MPIWLLHEGDAQGDELLDELSSSGAAEAHADIQEQPRHLLLMVAPLTYSFNIVTEDI